MKLFGKKKKKQEKNDADLGDRVRKILLGEELSEFIMYMKSPWRIMWSNLLGGIFRGLGIIIGMTVVIGIIIWFLSKMVDFPLIGQYFQDLLNLLQQFAPNHGYR